MFRDSESSMHNYVVWLFKATRLQICCSEEGKSQRVFKQFCNIEAVYIVNYFLKAWLTCVFDIIIQPFFILQDALALL